MGRPPKTLTYTSNHEVRLTSACECLAQELDTSVSTIVRVAEATATPHVVFDDVMIKGHSWMQKALARDIFGLVTRARPMHFTILKSHRPKSEWAIDSCRRTTKQPAGRCFNCQSCVHVNSRNKQSMILITTVQSTERVRACGKHDDRPHHFFTKHTHTHPMPT